MGVGNPRASHPLYEATATHVDSASPCMCARLTTELIVGEAKTNKQKWV